MRRTTVAAIACMTLLTGTVIGHMSPPMAAEASNVPSWVTIGSCYRSSTGIEFVYEIQGTWVRTEKDNPVQETWRNLAATPVVQRIPDNICKK